MPNRCVVYGCSSTVSRKKCVSMHAIPFRDDNRAEAIKRRQRWVDFVCQTRAHWIPGKAAAICSKHFTREDYVYVQRFILPPDKSMASILKRDEFGVSVWPTIHTIPEKPSQASLARARSISRYAVNKYSIKIKSSSVLFVDRGGDNLEISPGVQDEDLMVKSKDASTQTSRSELICNNCGKLALDCLPVDDL